MLRFTSCQGDSTDAFCKDLTAFIGEQLSMPSEYIGDIPWQERERRLDGGEIQAGWICGLPYVRKKHDEQLNLELLVAPVMKHPRYSGKPVYYSDVVVRADSSFRSFEDLQSRTWAYNEPASHSGYNLVPYHLAIQGRGTDFFGRIVESGSHLSSLQMLLDRAIDATAIDSTVLETEVAKNPSLSARIRTITILGPSPAPPWIVHGSVPSDLRHALRREFLCMDKNPRGGEILRAARMLRFVAVSDRDYELIREMERVAVTVHATNHG